MTAPGVPPELDIVRNPRARHMRLSVCPATGRVRLTLPGRMALRHALAWVEEKRAWIDRARAAVPMPLPFAPDARIPFGDGELRIAWRVDAPRMPRLEGNCLVCGGPEEMLAGRVERWLRKRALEVLDRETAEYAARAGVRVDKVAIGDPRSRWGSCSSTGVIRYSWRLILAPDFVRRATVAHEVAHRLHMNHSPAFHAAVREIFGADPLPARAWLRNHGTMLHRVGRAD